MDEITSQFGPWNVRCLPADGARIAFLAHAGRSILTAPPAIFRTPATFRGRFETRPVYGYDDCWPSVDACAAPGRPDVPDHGELCWLPWRVRAAEDRLECQVASRLWPGATFRRTLVFAPDSLAWRFELANASREPMRFLHIMHALMPPEEVREIRLPAFASAYDESRGRPAPLADADAAAAFLLSRPRGSAEGLVLRGVREGRFELAFRGGLRLRVTYDAALLPAMAIWWNRGAHVNEEGLQRFECAFEPLAGPSSSLAKCLPTGECMTATAGESLAWEIRWDVLA